jgi:hypothetical protein
MPPAEIAAVSGLTVEQVERAYASIDRKRRATAYLQLYPLTVDNIGEIAHTPDDCQMRL